MRLSAVTALLLCLTLPAARGAEDPHAGHAAQGSGHHDMTPEQMTTLRAKIPLYATYTDAQIHESMSRMREVWDYLSPAGVRGDVGVLGLGHGYGDKGDAQFKAGYGDIAKTNPTAVGLGMAMMDSSHIQRAVDALEAAGAKTIVVLPTEIGEPSNLTVQWDWILGRSDRSAYLDVPKLKTSARIVKTQTPTVSPITGEILAENLRTISREPSGEFAVLVAHGPTDATENEIELAALGRHAETLRKELGLAGAASFTLQDDAPKDVRDANVARIRDLIATETKAGRRVLVAPVLITGGGFVSMKIRKDLAGITFDMADRGLAESPLFATWVAEEVRAATPTAITPPQQRLRDMYEELVEINTTRSAGDTLRAAEAMAVRLRSAGFPAEDVHVLNPAPRKGNLVARLRGSGKRRPLLLLAHLDVVEAKREDWSMDPFTLTEQDGFFYGRGTGDDKAMAAIFVENLIRYREERYRPDRDIILLLETDEETNAVHGMRWLLDHHRDLIDAELALNEGGAGAYRGDRRLFNAVQASEKVYFSYTLEVHNEGGHSSLPVKDNAITRLAAGLVRLADFDFPVHVDEVNRAFFERTAAMTPEPLASDLRAVAAGGRDPATIARVSAASPQFNARLRTTCVATMLEGGHADNALPQLARAHVNCRIMPGETEEETRATLRRVLADDAIEILATPGYEFQPSPPSPLRPDVMAAIAAVTRELWPGLPVMPIMSTGASDSLYLRNAGIHAYGTSGIFYDIDDNRAHGRDERIKVQSLYEGHEYLYRLVKRLAGGRVRR